MLRCAWCGWALTLEYDHGSSAKARASLVVACCSLSTTIRCGGISHRDLGDGSGPGDTARARAAAARARARQWKRVESGSGTTGSGTTGSGRRAAAGVTDRARAEQAAAARGSADPARWRRRERRGDAGTGGTVAWDPNCTLSAERQSGRGVHAPRDCDVECGPPPMGNKHCTCYDGTYVDCSCPRPASTWARRRRRAARTATAHTASIKGTACSVEWEQCIALDPVTGVTPRGCVCLPNELGGNLLTWFCGLDRVRWFELAE